ncbi:hypothetical protein ACFL0X_01805 [Nanoarchaeota archaeon]
MTKELDTAKQRIVDNYSTALTEEGICSGPFQDRLLRGLEQVLASVTLPEGVQVERHSLLLGKRIDSRRLHLIAEKRYSATRLMNCLLNLGIRTYGELLDEIKNPKVNKPINEVNGIRIGFRGFGTKLSQVLYTHLNELGIQLFDDGYRPEELLDIGGE